MNSQHLIAALLLTLALVGCKPSQPPTSIRTVQTTPPVTIDFSKRGDAPARDVPSPDKAGVEPDAFCPLYSTIACRKMFACTDPKVIAIDAASLQFTDEVTCNQAMMRFCGSMMLSGVSGSVKEGRVIWDKASFGRCFRTWIDQACEPPHADLPAIDDCRNANKGTVALEGRCTTAFDCADGQGDAQIVCAFPESGPGTCKALGAPGAACAFSNDCRQELRCRQSTCQPPGQEGEPCRFKDDCAPGLLCPEASSMCTNPLRR